MTLGDKIRSMSDEELADFLEWSVLDSCTDPMTGEDYECFAAGCANNCSYKKRTENMLKWIKSNGKVIDI